MSAILKFGAYHRDIPVIHVTPDAPTVHRIMEACSAEWGISIAEMLGPRRQWPVVRARHAAMYLTVTIRPDLSYPFIGRLFQRDHTTIIHAMRKVSSDLRRDETFAARLERVRVLL